MIGVDSLDGSVPRTQLSSHIPRRKNGEEEGKKESKEEGSQEEGRQEEGRQKALTSAFQAVPGVPGQ